MPSGAIELDVSSIDALTASVQALPWSAHAVAGTAVVVGLLLWGVGRQVLKPLFCVIGGIAGAIGGFFAAGMIGVERIGDVPTPFAGLGVGGVLGMGIAASLYNFTVAVGFGAVAGLTGILVSATWLELHGQALAPERAAITVQHDRLAAIDAEHALILARPERAERTGRAARDADRSDQGDSAGVALTEQARELAWALADEARARWGTLDPRSQMVIALSGLGSAFVGFLIGLVLPGRSAAAATALLGSAVWITGAVWLAGALDAPGREYLDRGPKEWLIVWLGVACVGLGLQLRGLASRRSAPARE